MAVLDLRFVPRSAGSFSFRISDFVYGIVFCCVSDGDLEQKAMEMSSECICFFVLSDIGIRFNVFAGIVVVVVFFFFFSVSLLLENFN